MNIFVRTYRRWKFGRKFARIGKSCRFTGRFMEIEGHVEVGDHCRFRNNVILRTNGEGKIIFGDRTGASYYVMIEATKLVQIGSYTGIAEFTVIRDSNHMVYGTHEHFRYTPLLAEPVIIGEQVLIGSGCYIGPGVTIGDGAVIGAGSVVTRSIGPFEIWSGRPARFVSHRTRDISPEKMREFETFLAAHGVRRDRHVDIPSIEPPPTGDTNAAS